MEKTISIFDFANKLNGRAYLDEMTKEEEQLAKELGFVVVFGYSDDNAEFRGAYDDEVGCFNGGRIYQDGDLFIDAHWCFDGADWGYVTNIPSATFDIMQDGEVYCRGLVFEKTPSTGKSNQREQYHSIDEVLADMPEIRETIKVLQARGKPHEWVSVPADTSDTFAFLLKEGKMKNGFRAYPSSCENYVGYWLNGGSSAVQCKAVDFVLPGIVHHLYCAKNCKECPLHRKEVLENEKPL